MPFEVNFQGEPLLHPTILPISSSRAHAWRSQGGALPQLSACPCIVSSLRANARLHAEVPVRGLAETMEDGRYGTQARQSQGGVSLSPLPCHTSAGLPLPPCHASAGAPPYRDTGLASTQPGRNHCEERSDVPARQSALRHAGVATSRYRTRLALPQALVLALLPLPFPKHVLTLSMAKGNGSLPRACLRVAASAKAGCDTGRIEGDLSTRPQSHCEERSDVPARQSALRHAGVATSRYRTPLYHYPSPLVCCQLIVVSPPSLSTERGLWG